MIRLTRLNGNHMYLNADLIATVESHHDTVVTLVDGKCVVVSEAAEDVVRLVTEYRAQVLTIADAMTGGDYQPAGTETDAQLLLLRPQSAGE
jgi:flagellar protein FlbD